MKIAIEKSPVELTKQDFASDQMVKWCPGCGSHAILAAMENIFPEIGYKKEKYVNVSGIGCSSRFPYYVNTYGFHGIHGRANAIGTGVKISNPGLSVWISTGDGDSLAMPTSPMGAITKTSPMGTIEHPFNPGELVIGSQGTFFARVPDNNIKLMSQAMREAAKHDGCAVIEVLDNCVIFNDKAHAAITGKDVRDDHQLILEHGKPMIFGRDRNKGIRLNGTRLEVVEIGKDGITERNILVHDQYSQDPGIHLMLAKMHLPEFPVAMGVIRSAPAATYNQLLEDQIEKARKESKIKCMDDLLNSGDTWEIN